MINDTKNLGLQGEKAVAKFLINYGFKILGHNYQTKVGEIDLIAQKQDLIIFVEVKTRRDVYFPISNVITITKQKKIIKTAKLFAQKNNLFNNILRFDVATAVLKENKFEINYIKNAFQER
ncbi:MAG: hypothetical protein SZ59_C0002G0034 [candidate division TM6 bacterium GW2011_GWF2_28_16]|nr:MAG: hypothetical protein SZ59_C0002G0034 [candidate division TM6 bacterium GW2011_GWF2_28_16]